jgi:hypothetical protein
MPQKTINNRKHRIVNKLKTLMKNWKYYGSKCLLLTIY